MNIFLRELRAHRKSLILWSLGMLFMIISGMGKFASYSASAQSLNEIMAQIPASIRAILGMGDLDLTKISGYYGMLFLYLVIMVTIHGTMLGANIIAKEERDKTTEFLMVKPVSRSAIVTAKLAAALVNVVVLNLVTLVLSIAIVGQFSKGEVITGEILLLMGAMLILQLVFLFIGTGIAAASKNPRISPSIATTVLLVTFIFSAAIDMNSNLAVLKYVTPFKYFEAKQLIKDGSLEPVFVGLSLLIMAIMVWVTFTFYRKRDLKV